MSELMTLPELAQYLRFTRKTIYGLLKQGNIPAIKIGRKWRFDKGVIDEWLHRNMKGAKSHILVIDDEDVIRSLFKATLEEQGHEVVTASTGTEGLRYVKERDFDLVFLDLKLPDMEGAKVFREIKNVRPTLLVTIITGYSGSDMMEKTLKEGPLGVMNKPFTDSDIIAAVNSFLHVTQTRR
jgi:excisionase family DNA binding protein